MNRILSSIVLTFIGLNLTAQISIDHNDMPNAGEHFNFREAFLLPAGADESLTGEGITWDYSALNLGIANVDSFFTVSSAPLAYQFFFNNSFLYPAYKADYTRRTGDIDFGLVSLTNTVVFYKNNAQGLRNVGYGAQINGIPTSVQNDPIDYIYEFPLDYQDSFDGHSESEISVPTFGYFHHVQDRQTIVEGYGTLILPDASYEVLKVKVILNTTDSVYIDQFGTGFNLVNPEETIYQWIAAEHIEPVLEISQQLGFGHTIRYQSSILSAVNERQEISFELYPVPSSDLLNIRFKETGDYRLRLYDIQGRLIQERISRGDALEELDVNLLGTGGYYLQVEDMKSGAISGRPWIKE